MQSKTDGKMKHGFDIFESLKKGLIVSCQAEGDSPFNSPEGVALFAKAAELGGAKGIRSEGVAKTKMILNTVKIPVIGLLKSYFEDGTVRITGSFSDVENIIGTGCHITAVDGTFRIREGLTGPDFISKIIQKYNCIVMADISTAEEGIECAQAGAACISTTLNGYTPGTIINGKSGPNYSLLESLAGTLNIPVFAEGRINTPESAAEMMRLGAWSVIAGSAITRPSLITHWYIDAINKAAGI